MSNYSDDQLFSLVKATNKAFYDRVYADAWLKDMFFMITQELIEAQQTDFMVGALGGPKRYSGRSPKDAHPHLFVTEEIWKRREEHLLAAFKEVSLPQDLADRWIRIDESFKRAIVKGSVDECKKRFFTDDIISLNKRAA